VGTRLVIGRDLVLVSESDEGLELEGRARLRPGREVDVARGPDRAGQGDVRRLLIVSWRVARVGPAGILFRGFGRWC